MRTGLFALTLCLVALAGTAQAVSTVDPADPNILYTGRWSAETPTAPWCYWIGSSLIANFEGTSIAVTMQAGSGGSPDYLRVIIDDDAAGSSKIPVGSTTATHTLASGLADAVHKVEIIKETDIGSWTLYGLELDDGKTLTAPPVRPVYRIEFYGDSNLAGYSLEHEENNGGAHLRGSYYGYAGIASRMLDAEYHNVSRSGARIADINAVYGRFAYLSPNPLWTFGAFTPDVVVVNLGANDVGRPVHLIKRDYNDFLDDLRATHPNAHVVLYNSWGWDYDEPANYTHEVIADRGDPNMSVATFPWIFEQWHGCEYDHGGMAQILADHLTTVMGWGQSAGDVMNGYAMHGDVANGSFEERAPFGGYGWRYYTHAGVSRVSDGAGTVDGEHYLRLENGASSHQPIPAVDGQTFALQVWARGETAGAQLAVTMDFRDQEMWTSPLQAETETFSLTTDWRLYTMMATAPTGAANPVFHSRVTFAAGAGDVVDIDDVSMEVVAGIADEGAQLDGSQGPLGEWPDFTPIGYITAPHPDVPGSQTYLYGDWGGIVGEEFIFLQDDDIKLLYHSYHETYMTDRAHEEDLLGDWALGYNKVTKIKFPPLVQPGGPNPGPAWSHTDTPAYIEHPLTGEHLIYNTVRPGTKHLHPEWDEIPGYESAIQVATSDTRPSIGIPFDQTYENILEAELWWEQGWDNNGIIKGGLSEPTPVWVPHLGTEGKVRLFYRGLHGSPGSYWNWRISYADSEDGKTGWVKNPVPTFDPSDPDNPAYRWTLPPPRGFGFRGSWQAHCTGDTIAGGVHMVMSVSNQNYAGHGHLAYYWSPDWGDTWFGHPDNPIIAPGQFPDGVPATGFQRTPTLLVDDVYHRYVLAYNAGHDAAEPARRHTHLALASRPDVTSVSETPLPGSALQLAGITPNPGPGDARLEFVLLETGFLRVSVYTVDGRLVADVGEEKCDAGPHAVAWNKTADGAPVPSGIYFVRGTLGVDGRRVGEAVGRVVVLR